MPCVRTFVQVMVVLGTTPYSPLPSLYLHLLIEASAGVVMLRSTTAERASASHGRPESSLLLPILDGCAAGCALLVLLWTLLRALGNEARESWRANRNTCTLATESEHSAACTLLSA